jgi:hypothetical protein
MSGTSSNVNKFYKQHQTSSPNSSSVINQGRDSSDRIVWEMRNNYRQYYRNHTPNLTPLLNSPILNDDIRIIDQYQKVTSDITSSDSNGLRVLDSQPEGASNSFYSDKDIVVFDDIDETRGSWINSAQYANRLVTGFSPTSSHSSHSGNVSGGSDGLSSKNRVIGDIQIADLQGSPRRFGSTTHSNGQESPTESMMMDKTDKYQQARGVLHSPIAFSKRAPGFPKVFS